MCEPKLEQNTEEELQLIVDEKIPQENGEVLTKSYFRGNLLGKGGFAKCYEFNDMETNELYASKVINKASLSKESKKQKVNGL